MGEAGPQRAAVAVGHEYEATLSERARRAGAHYTGIDVARGLVEVALHAWFGEAVPRVLDPTCGGGVFLVAAADALVARGVAPSLALAAVSGCDLDPGAVEASNAAMGHWAAEHGCAGRAVARVADALELDDREEWDVIVGNPPFGSQMRRRTARDPQRRGQIAARFGDVARGTVDDAMIHAVAASTHLAPGGVLCLVLPRSTASASGAAVGRQVLSEHGLVGLWDPGERVFDASVEVIAPVVRSGAAPGSIRMYGGRIAAEMGVARGAPDDAVDQWAGVVAEIDGVPAPPAVGTAGVVADVASCAADFRQHYYALVGCVSDTRPRNGARLVTSGAIGVGKVRWDDRPVRFARERYDHPWVDIERFNAQEPDFVAWLEARLVPKLLVAPQGSVLRAAADEDGDMVPVTPLISVTPQTETMANLLAVVLSPAASAWCLSLGAGSGMSRDAIRPTAKMIGGIPLPAHRGPWQAAAEALEQGDPDWREFGELMDLAYGHDGRWSAWWQGRRGT